MHLGSGSDFTWPFPNKIIKFYSKEFPVSARKPIGFEWFALFLRQIQIGSKTPTGWRILVEVIEIRKIATIRKLNNPV